MVLNTLARRHFVVLPSPWSQMAEGGSERVVGVPAFSKLGSALWLSEHLRTPYKPKKTVFTEMDNGQSENSSICPFSSGPHLPSNPHNQKLLFHRHHLGSHIADSFRQTFALTFQSRARQCVLVIRWL